MMPRSIILTTASLAAACAAASHATFTGFTVVRGQGNPNGNIVWEIRANFNSTGLSAGQQWVFLNAYNWTTLGGSLSASDIRPPADKSSWVKLIAGATGQVGRLVLDNTISG